MRDQLLAFLAAAGDAAPDRWTPILVAIISTGGAGVVTLLVAFARKPDGRLGRLEERVEDQDDYIEDLRDQLWSHQIQPVEPRTKGTPP